MAKKTLRLTSILAFFCALLLCRASPAMADDTDKTAAIRYFSGRISDYSVGEDEYSLLRRRMYRSQEPLADQLRVNGSEPLSFGSGDEMYYILLDGDDDAADPTLSLVSTAADAELIVCGGIDDEMLADGGVLRFMVCSGRRYTEFELHCRTLPQMFLYVDGEMTRDDSSGRMLLYDNRAEIGQHWVESEIKIHLRGSSAATFPKQGFKISLVTGAYTLDEPRSIDLLGLRDDDDWVLYAGYNDPDRIRNVFSSKLWHYSCGSNNSFGLDNGMEYKYVELYINDKYWGLYALGYPVDGKQLQISKSSQGQTDEHLYRIRFFPSIDDDGSVHGFSLEYGTEYEDGSEWDNLRDYLEWLDRLQAGWTTNIYDRVDVPNAIDMYLFVDLVQGMDNVHRNFYISAKSTESGHMMVYTPWDLDLCWGSIWSESMTNFTHQNGCDPSVTVASSANPVHYYVISGDAHMIRLVCDRYWELRDGAWSDDSINEMLDEYEEDIFFSGAYKRDVQRWWASSRRSGTKDLSTFRKYVMERLEYMDEYISALPLTARVVICRNMLNTVVPA